MEIEELVFTYEEVFINLKLLSEIKLDDKLRVYGNNIDIDKRYVKSIARIIWGDSRNNTIRFINILINYATTFSNDLINTIKKMENDKHYKHQLNILTANLSGSINGLEKLKITYKDDNVFTANIDLILDKIRILIDNNMNNNNTIIKT